MSGKLKIITGVLLYLLAGGTACYAQTPKEEKHLLVSLRMIGHQVLLDSGDSTSRVFPIEKEGESYKIQFGNAFGFNPGDLAATVDQVMLQMKAASSYIVEVKRCENDEIVYSYEKGDSVNPELMPCGPRYQSKACYVIYLTVLKRYNLHVGSLYHSAPVQPAFMENPAATHPVSSRKQSVRAQKEPAVVPGKSAYSMIALPLGSICAFIGLFVYFRKKRSVPVSPAETGNPDVIRIGDTAFDQKNMTITCSGETTELSSKESDLLSVLFTHVNTTVEREHILKVVWGDEGDYIGRTLDVFISKLRKKLEPDTRIKIVNIRGVGYKFIVN
ncbi:response regulator transcription factor [Fluviicola sp.]|uniref:winged helix-turn-helix domain-containing protein n=1 Tax=Fluviicola sp. TaxID=1917219 RepID=UPI0031DDA351